MKFNWGISTAPKLPGQLEQEFLTTALGFGQLPAPNLNKSPSQFSIDDAGYVTFLASLLKIGASTPETFPKLAFLGGFTSPGSYTLYAIGGTDAFPLRGLYCADADLDANNPMLQKCTATDLEDFRIDIFNAGLYGAFAAVERKRARQVISDLAARGVDSDLLCVSEIARHSGLDFPDEQLDSTQEALIDAANAVPGGFRYFAQAKTDLDTVPDDLVDQSGNIPSPPGRAPCEAPVSPENIKLSYDCLINNCSSIKGDETAVTSGKTTCYSEFCGSNALGFLLLADDPARQCYNCIILNALSYSTWATNKQKCATDTRRPFAFNGTSPSMLLSKIPILETDQFVLATSAFRRSVIYAKLQHGENGLDVYCVHLPPLLGSNIAYTGAYANNAVNNGVAWQEEQTWMTPKIINWIQKKSMGRPAIIIGDWSSSAKVIKDGQVVTGKDGLPAVADVTPESIHLMQQTFTEAIPADYVPRCTRCPKGGTGDYHNAYNGLTDPQWNLRAFVKDPWASDLAQSASIFYDEPDRVQFPTPDEEYGLAGPLSDTFGYRINIRRP
jgi:hypothetical protein